MLACLHMFTCGKFCRRETARTRLLHDSPASRPAQRTNMHHMSGKTTPEQRHPPPDHDFRLWSAHFLCLCMQESSRYAPPKPCYEAARGKSGCDLWQFFFDSVEAKDEWKIHPVFKATYHDDFWVAFPSRALWRDLFVIQIVLPAARMTY